MEAVGEAVPGGRIAVGDVLSFGRDPTHYKVTALVRNAEGDIIEYKLLTHQSALALALSALWRNGYCRQPLRRCIWYLRVDGRVVLGGVDASTQAPQAAPAVADQVNPVRGNRPTTQGA